MQPETLPDGWTWVRFGDVVKQYTNHEREPEAAGIERVVSLGDLDPLSLRITRWSDVAEGTSFTKSFQPGHVLFGKRRVYQKKAALADFAGLCSGDIIVMEAKPKRLLPDLLPFIVQSDAFFDYAEKHSAGGLSPRTKWSSLAKFEMPLPPMDRQRELVEVFRGVENVLIRHEEAIDSIAELRRSLAQKIATSEEFERAPLSKLARLQVGYAYKSSWFVGEGEGVRLMRGENVGYGQADWSNTKCLDPELAPEYEEYQLEDGDIIIGMDRSFTASGFKVTDIAARDLPSLLVQRVGRFQLADGHRDYLRAILDSPYYQRVLRRNEQGTDIPHLSKTDILGPDVPIPPYEEQIKLGGKHAEVRSAEAALRKNLRSVERVKRSLLTEMLAPSEQLAEAA